jgi:hypothetical protein
MQNVNESWWQLFRMSKSQVIKSLMIQGLTQESITHNVNELMESMEVMEVMKSMESMDSMAVMA